MIQNEKPNYFLESEYIAMTKNPTASCGAPGSSERPKISQGVEIKRYYGVYEFE